MPEQAMPNPAMRAAIVGIAGPALTGAERTLLADHPPAGIILFSRNIEHPAQLAALVADLRAALPPGALLAVDQEGGRVARLRPPHWRAHPPAAAHATARAAWLTGALVGADCAAAGLHLVCAPVLDLRVPGASHVVGDRAWSDDPVRTVRHGLAMASGLAAAGCIAVAKHAPGHGRARVDSHHHLPRIAADIDLGADLGVFRACAPAFGWMMTAHIVYDRWDDARPATWSPTVVSEIIRGAIGFAGTLVSDDLAMGALDGPPARRAELAWRAGVDIALHCSGALPDSHAVLAAAPNVPGAVRARMAPPAPTPGFHPATLAEERSCLLAN